MKSLQHPSKNCKSWCWEHYKRYEQKGQKFVGCMFCFEAHRRQVKSGTIIPQSCMLSASSDGSTTNLISHLRYRHPETHKKYLRLNAEGKDDASALSVFTGGGSILKHTVHSLEFPTALKRWIVDGLQPLRIVESKSF